MEGDSKESTERWREIAKRALRERKRERERALRDGGRQQ